MKPKTARQLKNKRCVFISHNPPLPGETAFRRCDTKLSGSERTEVELFEAVCHFLLF